MKKSTKSLLAAVLSVAMAFAPMAVVNNGKNVNASTTKTVNLALGKTVTASSHEDSSLSAQNAVDGNLNTRWSSAWKDGEWIMVDLGDIYPVGSVSIYWEAAYASEYSISWSQDNVTWNEATTRRVSGYMEDTCDMFYNRPVRYIKITCDKRATSYGASIYEIEILGTVTEEETTQEQTTTRKDGETTVDWSGVDYAGDGAFGGQAANQYKFAALDNNGSLVNIQKPGFAAEAGLYVTFDSAVTSSSLSDYYVQGAGVILALGNFAAKETQFTVTTATGTYKCAVYNAKGGNAGEETQETTQETTTASGLINDSSNLAFGKTVVASSEENASYAAQFAVDGNLNTRWSSAWKDGEWIMVDLGRICTVSSVQIYWEAAYASNYTVSYSTNGVDWSDLVTKGMVAHSDSTYEMFFNRPARYIKITANSRATSYGVSIYDIVVKGPGYSN